MFGSDEPHNGGRNSSRIFSTATLPCGRVVPNRLVKVAMYEHLADMFGGAPNSNHFNLYSRWANHGWGMIITGNVQVSPKHLSLGRDMVIPASISEEALGPFRTLSQIMNQHRSVNSANSFARPLAIMQLSHAGRQSPNILGGRTPFAPPLSPSPIVLGSGKKSQGFFSGLFHWLLFQVPQEMSLGHIDDVVQAFTRGAELAALAGFDGVQLHAAHGYLIAQFVSPKTNRRTDEYSCKSCDPLNFLHRIVTSIRKVVPANFVLGVKVNASDYVDVPSGSVHSANVTNDHQYTEGPKATQESRALGQIRMMANWHMIDFIEISGGDYETPEFMSLSKSPRQAFFSHFSRQAMEAVQPTLDAASGACAPLILLTGGLRTPSHLETAITSRHAHLLGIGRGAITCPDLPDVLKRMEDGQTGDVYAPFAPDPNLARGPFGSDRIGDWVWTFMSQIQLIGAGASMAWYIVMIRRLAQSHERKVQMDYEMGATSAIFKMWITLDITPFATAGFTLLLAGFWYCIQYSQ